MPLSIKDDLAKLAEQEKALVLPHFDNDIAWRIGTTLRDLAIQRKLAVAIDVRRFGQPLFFCALEGTSFANSDWVRRKSNVVAHFLRSSYAVGLDLRKKKTTLTGKARPICDRLRGGWWQLSNLRRARRRRWLCDCFRTSATR